MLCYHRIAETDSDPWQLCVSPRHFEEHLEVLEEYGRAARLDQVAAWARGERGALSRGLSYVVTFDDGYADVLENALPILRRTGTPATAFLVTDPIRRGHAYYWDELERILLEPGTLPAHLSLELEGNVHTWTLDDDASYEVETARSHRSWRADGPSDPTLRHRLYRELYGLIRAQTAECREQAMSDLAAWSGRGRQGHPTRRVLTPAETCELTGGGLVDVGCHTCTHPVLPDCDEDVQRRELADSKATLEELLDAPVTAVAYPHGRFSTMTLALVEESGYDVGCTTAGQLVQPDLAPFEIPRVAVVDCDGATFERTVLNVLLA